jgi:hypothetical protein
MARSSQKGKEKKPKSKEGKGTYGSKLKLSSALKKTKSRNESSSSTISSDRKRRKIEAAAKKSNHNANTAATNTVRDKPKAKSKHHVAKFTKNSIKQRVHAAKKSHHLSDRHHPIHAVDNNKRRRRKSKSTANANKLSFQMNLPDSNHAYYLKPKNVPWYQSELQDRFRDNYNVVQLHPAPTDKSCIGKSANKSESGSANNQEELHIPSEAILSQIDHEIQSFAAYVKLTPSERKARNAFLSHIEEILVKDFAGRNGNNGSSRGGYNRRIGNEEEKKQSEIYVEPFGSYATQEVCTFASDVDMCLWGLVKDEEVERVNSHYKFVSSDSVEEANDEDEVVANGILSKGGECALLTESSLLRTMDAIQSAQMKKSGNGQCVSGGDKKQSTIEKVEISSDVIGDDAPIDSLFVIDRVGVNMDAVDAVDDADDVLKSSEGQRGNSDVVHTDTNNKSSKVNNKTKQKNVPKEQFQFAIDIDGVQELGGDPQDLPNFTEMAESKSETPDHSSEKIALKDKLDANSGVDPAPAETDESSKVQQKPTTAVAAAPNGKSLDDAINIDDQSSVEDEAIVLDDESTDEADKLDSFYSRQQDAVQLPQRVTDHASFSTSIASEKARISATNERENDIISIGDSSDDSDYGHDMASSRDNEVLELSVTSNLITNSTDSSKPIVKPSFGPTGKIRVRVISVLQGLTSHLRRSSFTNTVECRSRARVPIVNCNTRTGFEGDIAIGGHNGVDTSTYAKRQVDRFQR